MKNPRRLSYGIAKHRTVVRNGKSVAELGYAKRKVAMKEKKEEARRLKRLERNELFV